MRWTGGIVLVIVAAAAQVSLFGHLRPLGIIPNVVMIAVILIALWGNATPAVAAAVGGGLLLDSASGSDFGVRMAFFTVVALAIVAGRQFGLNATSVLTGVVLVVLATLGYNAVMLVLLHTGIPPVALQRIGAEVVVNLVLTLLIFVVRANLGRRTTSLELGDQVR